MIFSKRFLKVSGIILIILGVVICAGLIVYQYLHCVAMWNSDKSMLYDSAMDYFIEVSTGAMLISLVLGCIPAFLGTLLLKKN